MRFAIPSVILAILLALCLGHAGLSRLPQVVKGDDALSVAFSDAKATISAAMVHKADSYFHGGIDMECHESHEHGQEEGHAHEPGCAHCAHGHAHDEEHPHEHSLDPWRWINSHVRAPERHVHLDGGKAVELMPWFWAAVRADPHNVDAWTTAWYTADTMLKDRELARRILDEAKEKNPESLEIAWTEARFVYDGGRGDVAAAEQLLEAARALGRRKCGGNLSSLSSRDAETYCYILDYLSALHAKRGDHDAIRRLIGEVCATGANTPVLEWMRQRLH